MRLRRPSASGSITADGFITKPLGINDTLRVGDDKTLSAVSIIVFRPGGRATRGLGGHFVAYLRIGDSDKWKCVQTCSACGGARPSSQLILMREHVPDDLGT